MDSQIIEDLKKEKVILRKWKMEDSNVILNLIDKLTTQNITINQLKETKISQVVATIAKSTGATEVETNIIMKEEQKDLEKSIKLDQLKHEKDAKAAQLKKNQNRKNIEEIEPKPQKQIKLQDIKDIKEKSNSNSPKIDSNSSPTEAAKLKYNGQLPHYDNEKRGKAAAVLYDALQTDFDKSKLSINDKEYIIGVVVGVEKALYEKHNIIDQKYENDIRKLNANLKNKNNPDFRRKVINQELSFKEVAKVDPSTMTSEKNKKEKQQIEANMLEGRLSDWHTEFLKKNAKPGGCMCINPKCRSTKTLTRLQQTRGADEPMTEFNECLDCGKKWKV